MLARRSDLLASGYRDWLSRASDTLTEFAKVPALWHAIDVAHALRATVKDGHLVLDEPVDLPEGTVVDLMPVDQLSDASYAIPSLPHRCRRRSQMSHVRERDHLTP